MKISMNSDVPRIIGREGSYGPDFICVGAQKGGTRWLFDQLEQQPEFWMPPLKELRYFNRHLLARRYDDLDQRVRDLAVRQAKIAKRRIASGTVEPGRRPLGDADVEWLDAFIWLSKQPYDLDLYGKLFSPKGDRLSGDISPGYAIIDRSLALDARRAFPGMKVLYIARDPVSRCWSHYCMEVRKNRWDDGGTIARFRQFFASETPKALSSATRAIDTWRLSEDDANFRLVFFDHLESQPATLKTGILAFLGGETDPARADQEFPSDFNRKSDQAKIDMPETAREIMVEAFAGEMREAAKRYGAPADGWLARYGVT